MISLNGIKVGIEHDWVKPLEKNLYEIRSRVSNNQYRGIYFHVDGKHYVITHGFTKKLGKLRLEKLSVPRLYVLNILLIERENKDYK